MHKSSLLTYLTSFCFFTLLGVYITYPLIFHMTDRITSLGDEYLIIFIQNWVIHALSTHPLQLFNAPIYFPYQGTLAFSDTHLTTSILAWPILLLMKEPLITFNFTLLSSIILLGFSIFCLSFYVTKKMGISLVAGMLTSCSPVITDKMTHLQVLSIWGVPFAILFFLKFLEKRKMRYFILCLVCFLLQTYNSFLPGYFIVFSLILISLFSINNKKKHQLLFQKKTILFTLVSGLLLLPVVIPYYHASKDYNFSRDIRDAIHLGLQPEDLLVGNLYTNAQPILARLTPQSDLTPKQEVKVGYVGGVLSLLTAWCIFYIFRTVYKRKRLDRTFLMFFSIAVVGLVLSFGPALHLFRQTIHHPFPIILPYALLYYIIPGFNGMRNAARWEVLFVLGMSVAGGILLSTMTKNMSRVVYRLSMILLFSLMLLELHIPDRFVSIVQQKNFPKVYREVGKLPEQAVIIELPIYNWYMPYSGQELIREYYATAHFHRMVNGASGFSPLPWQNMVTSVMQSFPNDSSIKQLKQLGVTHIILHTDEYTRLYTYNAIAGKITNKTGEEVRDLLSRSNSVKLIKTTDAQTLLYAIQ